MSCLTDIPMDTHAIVNYHVGSSGEQAFRVDADGANGTLTAPELAPTGVAVRDVRNGIKLAFAGEGVTFVNRASAIRHFDASNDWQQAYDQELAALLAEEIGAKETIVFDHTVRIDDPAALRRPARNVHTDYSPASARQRLRALLGEDVAASWEAGHYAFVNVWRPVGKRIVSAPLGFVRPASVATEDWISIDVVYPDRVGAIYGLLANDAHDWIYLSGMSPDEVAVFNIFDNRGRPAIAHSALDLIDGVAASSPRMSVESRTLVRY